MGNLDLVASPPMLVVVVKLLATDEDAPRNDVAAGIARLESAVTEIVADAIDHAGDEGSVIVARASIVAVAIA